MGCGMSTADQRYLSINDDCIAYLVTGCAEWTKDYSDYSIWDFGYIQGGEMILKYLYTTIWVVFIVRKMCGEN